MGAAEDDLLAHFGDLRRLTKSSCKSKSHVAKLVLQRFLLNRRWHQQANQCRIDHRVLNYDGESFIKLALTIGFEPWRSQMRDSVLCSWAARSSLALEIQAVSSIH